MIKRYNYVNTEYENYTANHLNAIFVCDNMQLFVAQNQVERIIIRFRLCSKLT